MKLKTIFSSLALVGFMTTIYGQDNRLSAQEKATGWILLFDGKSFDGWSSPDGESPDSVWKIDNGTFHLQQANSKKHMDIITTDQYGDFDLRVDFKLTEGANSGIKYFFNRHNEGGWLGLEYQIIDNERHADARNESRRLGALYDMFAVDKVIPVRIGEWNQARIVSKGSSVTHYLNGQEVLSFDRKTANFEQARQNSKYNGAKPKFGSFERGHILIQDHRDMVYFKNVKIRPL